MPAPVSKPASIWLRRAMFVAAIAVSVGCGTAQQEVWTLPAYGDRPSGPTITYRFTGYLEGPFGTLPAHEFFFGSFTYVEKQDRLPPILDFRADYRYKSLSLTIGAETATDEGSGVMQVSDKPSLPSDNVHIYPFEIEARLGGMKLSPSAGLQLLLSDSSGMALSSNVLPGAELTLDDFTLTNNASSLKLQSREFGEQSGVLLSLRGAPDP